MKLAEIELDGYYYLNINLTHGLVYDDTERDDADELIVPEGTRVKAIILDPSYENEDVRISFFVSDPSFSGGLREDSLWISSAWLEKEPVVYPVDAAFASGLTIVRER